MSEPKIALMVYRMPPQQQVALFRIFPMLGYYMIGMPKRGLMFFAGIYPIMVVAQSVADTLANDLGWNVLIATFMGITVFELWNYLILCDLKQVSRRCD